MSIKKYICGILLISTLFIFIDLDLFERHELAHVQACKLYGGEATITYNYFLFLKTSGQSSCSIQNDNLTMLNAFHEESEYPFISILLAIYLTNLLIWTYVYYLKNR